MSGTLVVARRELAGLFKAPFTWIVMVIVLLLNGVVFTGYLQATGGNISDALNVVMTGLHFWTWMVFLPALLAMKLIAEESRTGTLEYLLTAPVSDGAVVLGKFTAAAAFLAILWLSPMAYAVVIEGVGGAPDWPAVLATWIGVVLASSLFVAIGLFASTFTATPLLAAFLSMVACVTWLVLPFLVSEALRWALPLMTDSGEARELVRERVLGVVDNMDAVAHFQNSFRIGVLDTAEVCFFMTWTALFLFMTARSLEARRWRG